MLAFGLCQSCLVKRRLSLPAQSSVQARTVSCESMRSEETRTSKTSDSCDCTTTSKRSCPWSKVSTELSWLWRRGPASCLWRAITRTSSSTSKWNNRRWSNFFRSKRAVCHHAQQAWYRQRLHSCNAWAVWDLTWWCRRKRQSTTRRSTSGDTILRVKTI